MTSRASSVWYLATPHINVNHNSPLTTHITNQWDFLILFFTKNILRKIYPLYIWLVKWLYLNEAGKELPVIEEASEEVINEVVEEINKEVTEKTQEKVKKQPLEIRRTQP